MGKKLRRKFSDGTYSWTQETKSRYRAKESAERIRGQGDKARVVKRSSGTYGVYRGPKRKTRSKHERRSAKTAFRKR